MTVSIRLQACGKSFGGARVLQPIGLTVGAGETIVLLGPSGCGKTTLLRLIAGLETPDPGGRVFFGDRDVTALPIEQRNVGMVFQSYALFPNMTVAGNIGYGLKIRGMDARTRHARVQDMLAMMRIETLGDRSIGQLSGGQRQRVALARAIAVKPDVLLLDEPLTALDAQLRDVLRVEIDALLRGLGITTVYVTHDQTEAMALGDRIAVLSAGHIAQIGTPRDIWFSPASRFVASFIGVSSHFPGTVGGGVLRFLSVAVPWSGADGAVDVVVRTDAARLLGPAEQAAGAMPATVRTSQFLGDRTRLALVVDQDQVLLLDADARDAPVPGAAVTVAFDVSALMVVY
jgi:putative spermidine/putrescine transport system ATP-binding protein